MYMIMREFVNIMQVFSKRLSSTIGGNREMDQLYSTSQVSNIKKPNFLTLVDMFSKIEY